MVSWKTRITALVVALVATVGVGALEASSADAAIKVCAGTQPCGHVGGPGQL